MGAALLAASAWILASTPDWLKAHARFNLVFAKIVKNSPAPGADLVELGLSSEDVRYTGRRTYEPGSPMAEPAWAESFRARCTYWKVLAFYLRHPLRAGGILWADLQEQSWDRRGGLSNFQRESGRPEGATAASMASWSAVRAWALRKMPVHIALWLAVLPPVALRVAMGSGSRRRRALAWTALAAGLAAAGEFGIASLADACETSRHLLMFHVLTDVSIFLSLALAAGALEQACPASWRKVAAALTAAGVAVVALLIAKAEAAPYADRIGMAAGAADDGSLRVAYSGKWSAGTFRQALGGTVTYSNEPGATARFRFEGTGLEYVYTKAFNRGMALVTIDGIERGTIDLYHPQIVWNARTVFDGLKPGRHEAEIRVLGRRNPEARDGFVDIDALAARR